MPRSFNIIGVGETLLVERAEGREAAGLAARVALNAVRLGDTGVVVSRVGQDEAAGALLGLLAEAGVDTSHVQSDPDLPTGRVIERAIGAPVARYLDSPAAFDNLQADFDLDDVAQQADAVVFGLLTRRAGQTRAQENRFIEACAGAVKVMDVTNPPPGADRGYALSGLELADGALVDRAAITLLDPGSGDRPLADAARDLQRRADLAFVLSVETGTANDGRSLTAYDGEGSAVATIPPGRTAEVAAIVGLLDRVLRGHGMQPAVEFAARIAAHAHASPRDPVPREWLDAGG